MDKFCSKRVKQEDGLVENGKENVDGVVNLVGWAGEDPADDLGLFHSRNEYENGRCSRKQSGSEGDAVGR